MIVGITGSRSFRYSSAELISSKMLWLVTELDVDTICFGGAKGADTIALSKVLEFRKSARFVLPKLIVILPNKLESQPPETHYTTRLADEVIELGLRITAEDHYEAYHARNRSIVDRSDEIVAFWNGDYASGTWSCIKYAKSVKKPVEEIRLQK